MEWVWASSFGRSCARRVCENGLIVWKKKCVCAWEVEDESEIGGALRRLGERMGMSVGLSGGR